MKNITLSILQLDADREAGNYKGIIKFIDGIDPLYQKLLNDYKYRETEFKNEVFELIKYLFIDDKIYDLIKEVLFKNGQKVEFGLPIDPPRDKKIMELQNKYDPDPFSLDDFKTSFVFKPEGERDLLKDFVDKYRDRFKEKGLSYPEQALIAVYEGRIITRNHVLYGDYIKYSDKRKRTAIETSRLLTLNKIKRIEKIIPYLSMETQQIAIDDVELIRARLEGETF